MKPVNYDVPILLIDDDAIVRDVLLGYLSELGLHNVLTVRDPAKALRVIRDPKIPIGLVLSDWEMPRVSGLTLLKAVRNCPHRRYTKFIMVTSQQSMERVKITQAKQFSVSGYLVKPFRSEVLKQHIWQVMGWGEGAMSEAG